MNPADLTTCYLSELPSEYKFLRVQGEGSFGKVVRCLNKETNETVAIKFPKYLDEDTMNEIPMLRKIKCYNLDEHNIVKYIDCFETRVGKALVFEPLDMSLYDYIKMRGFAPMLLSDIRTIIQQMATAFDALKGLQVIHTDVKLDNIMMVNHLQRPFEVKLIDFGLAMHRSVARAGTILQPDAFRSPEIILGCPFSEAIDMWALGCAMFRMICGSDPFSGENEHEIMLSIVELLGQPTDHILDKGDRTRTFFKDTDDKVWRIKTPIEHFKCRKRRANKNHMFPSLDYLKAMRLEKNNNSETVQREQCIELLKAMLEIDPDKRITPCEVLTHPFITKDYLNVQTDMVKTSTSEDFECEPPAAPLKDEDSINIQPDDCTPSPEILPSGVILVRPLAAKDTLLLEDLESTVSEPPDAPLKEKDSISIQRGNCTPSPEILPSGVILVRPLAAEDTLLLEDLESTDNEPPAAPLKVEVSISIQRGVCTPSPEILPSGVILVRPLAAEDTLLLEDLESTVNEPPAAPLKVEDRVSVQRDNFTPSPQIFPSGVILVRPVTAGNTLLLEDLESTVSFQSGLNETSVSSVSDSNPKISEDATTCEDTGMKKKGKKKKNRLRHVVSWLKNTFSRVSPID